MVAGVRRVRRVSNARAVLPPCYPRRRQFRVPSSAQRVRTPGSAATPRRMGTALRARRDANALRVKRKRRLTDARSPDQLGRREAHARQVTRSRSHPRRGSCGPRARGHGHRHRPFRRQACRRVSSAGPRWTTTSRRTDAQLAAAAPRGPRRRPDRVTTGAARSNPVGEPTGRSPVSCQPSGVRGFGRWGERPWAAHGPLAPYLNDVEGTPKAARGRAPEPRATLPETLAGPTRTKMACCR